MEILFTFFYQPTANLLLFPLTAFETGSIVFGIIVSMLIIKLALLRLSVKNTRVQIQMQTIAEELKKIRETIKDKKDQAEKTMEIYRGAGINPFTPLLLILIQIPIFISIFFVVKDIGEGTLNYSETLYSFVQSPPPIETFLFTLNLAEAGNLIIALLVGVTQAVLMWYIQKHITDQSKKMQKMLFLIVFPIVAAVASFFFVAAVGVYWFVNNLFSILQEILVINHIRTEEMRKLEPEHP